MIETTYRYPVRAFEGHVLRALQANLHGQVITPDQPKYEVARKIWNGFIDRYPTLVVRCVDENDVVHAIRFARSQNLEIAVRGGGHSFPGYSMIDDGLVIDLSLMKDVLVDAEQRTALVSAGVKLGELIQATQQYGMVTPVGSASDTGVAGLTLGGGFGYLTGVYGLACDNVLSFNMVTAEGSLVRASASENSDLFWGLRGGGGNFGVVTTFEFKLHPLPMMLGGLLIYPMAKAREVLRDYRSFCEQAPDELTLWAGLATSPEGQPIVSVLACYGGDLQEGERILEPLRKFGQPVVDGIRPMTYLEMISMLDEAFLPESKYYDKGCTLPHLSDATIEVTVEAGAALTSPFSAITIAQMHGAAARVPVEATAYPVRGEHFISVIVAAWKEGPANAHIEWARKTYAAYKPHTINETYVNFISGEEQHIIQSVYGGNYARLQELKRRYDPDNVFHRNANIKP